MDDGKVNGAKPRDPDFYAGYTRFEIELEFVQSLSNPYYLQYLAAEKYLDNEEFIAYLEYLQYFKETKYLKYLQYPGPTLRALELLQEERFRKEIIVPGVVEVMVNSDESPAEEGARFVQLERFHHDKGCLFVKIDSGNR